MKRASFEGVVFGLAAVVILAGLLVFCAKVRYRPAPAPMATTLKAPVPQHALPKTKPKALTGTYPDPLDKVWERMERQAEREEAWREYAAREQEKQALAWQAELARIQQEKEAELARIQQEKEASVTVTTLDWEADRLGVRIRFELANRGKYAVSALIQPKARLTSGRTKGGGLRDFLNYAAVELKPQETIRSNMYLEIRDRDEALSVVDAWIEVGNVK